MMLSRERAKDLTQSFQLAVVLLNCTLTFTRCMIINGAISSL